MNFAKSKFFKVCSVLMIALVLMAQQPVTISSGSVTANAGTNLNTSALALDATISTLDTDVKSNVTLHAGTNVIGHVIVDTAPSTAVTNAGTFATQAAESGTWTVQPGNTANSTPWLTTDSATSATGSAVPAKASYIAGEGSGNLTGYINCDNTAIYDASTSGSTQLVALSSSKKVYVCGGLISTSQATSVNVKLIYGTGTACVTGSTNMTPAWPLQAATSTGPIGLQIPSTNTQALATAASNELCINTSTGVSVQALIYYTQF